MVSVAGGWGWQETAPPQPSTGHAETADGHTTTADAAILAVMQVTTRCNQLTNTHMEV